MTRLSPQLELQPEPSVNRPSNRVIGKLLIEAGRLKAEEAERIAAHQKRLGLRFGEAGVQLGLLTETEVRLALSTQYGYSYLHPGQGNFSSELVAAYLPFTAQAEALRTLRTELLLRWFNPDHKVLALVSTEEGDGRSYLAANLAVAFAQLGESTLLIDANLRNPRLHKMFSCDNRTGLSSILSGRVNSHSEAIAHLSVLPSFYLLPAGPIPPNPLELLGQPVFALLLAYVAQRYEIVLIDTPPTSTHADAQVVAARAGGALMLVRRDRTKLADAQKLIDTLAASRTPIVGTTMNHR
jgi:protein-tyrosine kinase